MFPFAWTSVRLLVLLLVCAYMAPMPQAKVFLRVRVLVNAMGVLLLAYLEPERDGLPQSVSVSL